MIPSPDDITGGGAASMLRALAIAVAAGLLTAAIIVAGTRWWMPSLAGAVGDPTFSARTRAWFVTTGFYPPESDAAGRPFSWVESTSRIEIPHLDRSHPYRLNLKATSGRPPDARPPRVTVLVDNQIVTTIDVRSDPVNASIDLPVRARAGAVVRFETPDTFVPGPGDPRSLAFMVNAIDLVPVGGPIGPASVTLVEIGLSVALVAAAILWCGVPMRWAWIPILATTAAFSWLLMRDGAFLGPFADRLFRIALGAGAIGAIAGLVRIRWPVVCGLPEWSAAVGLVLWASVVKLAFFTHPQIALTDALFQVHRAMLEHRGEYFFTSVTPSPSYEFPYAIALYIAASPVWSYFKAPLDLANLLRGVSLIADALVGIALYAAARRQWNDPVKALLAAALWPFARGPAMALGHANLTNLFGQGLFGTALGMVGWASARAPARLAAWVVIGLVVTAAFLSHFSTLSTGLLLLGAVVLALFWRGDARLRRFGGILLFVSVAAAAISYVVYYSHFNALYIETFRRVVTGADAASPKSMVAPFSLKVTRWLTEDQFSNDYGVPGLPMAVAACAGLWLLLGRRAREGFTLVLVAWACVWVAATLLGLLTSVEFRANLASAPMFVAAAAYALGTLAERSRVWATVAAAIALWIVWDGVHVWLMWIGAVPM